MKFPLGYSYAAAYAGIRKQRKNDVGLIFSAQPASAAAVFTQNLVQAWPVKAARASLQQSGGKVSAVLVNAGNANCATKTGQRAVNLSTSTLAQRLGILPEQVFPASTGVIGVELDPLLLVGAIPGLVDNLNPRGFDSVAEAIMTTDLVPKVAWESIRGVCVAGMTKGSGMIHPQMATTLGFVVTDAQLTVAETRRIVKRAVEQSYNRLSVDGDTSTNDAVLLLANGKAGKTVDPALVQEAVTHVMEDLARQIARDGEGASKLIIIEVKGTPDDHGAATIARAIANSPLVKTAVAGSDPNWGRILSAAGNAGVSFDPSRVQIRLQGVTVCRHGVAAGFSEEELKRKLGDKECVIHFTVRGGGNGRSRFWTCDFTEGYIRINASYRT